MLFHVSIEASDPRRVATILAEVLGGAAAPFPPVAHGSWVALAGDDRGTMIEVYPLGTELHPGEGSADAFGIPGPRRARSGVHLAIATELDSEAIFAIAGREGWPVKQCRRGDAFGVIEIWIEGHQLVEVLTAEMQREYLDTVTIENWNRMLEERRRATLADAA